MKRLLTFLLVLSLAGAALGGPASAKKRRYERQAEDRYVAFGMATSVTGMLNVPIVCHHYYDWGCAAVDVYYGERYASVEIADQSGMPAAALLYQCETDACSYTEDIPICGATEEPVKLHRRTNWVGVMLVAGPCPDGTPAAVTEGSATFTLSNVP